MMIFYDLCFMICKFSEKTANVSNFTTKLNSGDYIMVLVNLPKSKISPILKKCQLRNRQFGTGEFGTDGFATAKIDPILISCNDSLTYLGGMAIGVNMNQHTFAIGAGRESVNGIIKTGLGA